MGVLDFTGIPTVEHFLKIPTKTQVCQTLVGVIFEENVP